ncbi:Haloacid dehalogenase-like hydrolase-domain-containing protein [Coprinopsis sp. MPI-PUGE-AT-0042]|nr:Haloacid dehalogenase-like hydrolase-domain-containing protein [Coprinopsis sp. MPI-PUGE-AT-0042]
MAVPFSPYTAIIFDLGDVLFQWSATTRTALSSKALRALMSTDIWYDYECGRISQEACYSRLAERGQVRVEDVYEAMHQAKESLTADFELVDFVRQIKKSNPYLRIFALSNVSLPDFEVLRLKPAEWGIFERVFTSGEIGERKPNLGGYKHLIAATGIDPRRTIFVDDKLENVFSAESLGFKGITFDTRANAKQKLLNLLCPPIPRASAYLQANQGKLGSVLGTCQEDTIPLPENFAQLLILEATNKPSLVHLVSSEDGLWNYFHDPKFMSQEDFPPDLDTNSLAYKLLKDEKSALRAHQLMDQILAQCLNCDGLPQTYFDTRRPRLDAGVCACVVSLFYSYGRGAQVSRMVDWLFNILSSRAYLLGTYYYLHPEYFLYSIFRILNGTTDGYLHFRFTALLKQCVEERVGVEGDALALAMRIVVCNFVGLRNSRDLQTLLSLQLEDGGWPLSWVYRVPSKKVKVGNRGLATAVAINAIQGFPLTTATQDDVVLPVNGKQCPFLHIQVPVALCIAVTCILSLIPLYHLL